MTAGQDAWAELMKASLGMMSTGFQVGEMMLASSSVIGARMTEREVPHRLGQCRIGCAGQRRVENARLVTAVVLGQKSIPSDRTGQRPYRNSLDRHASPRRILHRVPTLVKPGRLLVRITAEMAFRHRDGQPISRMKALNIATPSRRPSD